MNPFLINAMIGGSILADGIGKPPKLSDQWPRRFTVVVLLAGMVVAMLALRTGQKPVKLIIFGQALTVIGNPLMAVTILWLANRGREAKYGNPEYSRRPGLIDCRAHGRAGLDAPGADVKLMRLGKFNYDWHI